MMLHTAPLLRRYFRGGELNTLVDLDRIAINYFAAKVQGQLIAQHALAGGSRSDNGDDPGSAGILPAAVFVLFARMYWLAHPREMISRITITSQMIARNRIAPMI